MPIGEALSEVAGAMVGTELDYGGVNGVETDLLESSRGDAEAIENSLRGCCRINFC